MLLIAQFPHDGSELIRNYLSGNIPPKWASMQLEYM
jgi:hypothetical protein